MRQRKDVDLDTDLVKDEELDDLAAAETRAPSIASWQGVLGSDHVDQVGKKSQMPLPERTLSAKNSASWGCSWCKLLLFMLQR
jgi:hypothetical protein